MKILKNGVVIENDEQHVPAVDPTYAEKRAEEYGDIGDQLDMIFKDALNGTTTWQDHIAAVKAKYPKV